MFISADVEAQSYRISGSIYDAESGEALTGASVVLFSLPDSTIAAGVSADQQGQFSLRDVEPGEYKLRATYLGYQRYIKSVEIEDEDLDDLEIRLLQDMVMFQELTVTARRPAVQVRGDTTQYNADSYALNPNAMAGDLISRMPGFIIQDGQLHAQGEEVQRVLVDGEEFFGRDAMVALQNLPAELVDNIEVFNRQSDQARFTGFSVDEGERTVNIVTKEDKNHGRFGRANTGYGTEDRYLGSGNYNRFQGSRRLSVVGMTNNIDQRNLSSEDLSGIAEASDGGGRGRRGGSARDFRMRGGSEGISSVNSTGINYIDNWNDTWKVNASYFFNQNENVNDRHLERRYISGTAEDQFYDEDTYNTSEEYSHRFNMRMEYDPDDDHSFIFTPSANFRNSQQTRTLSAFTQDPQQNLINQVASENRNQGSGFDLSAGLLYRHRFDTEGRTLSANVNTSWDDRSGTRFQFDENFYFDEFQSNRLTDQQRETVDGGFSISTDVTFTESIGENSQLRFSYRPSYDRNESIRDTYSFDEQTGAYTRLDTTLTNRYDNQVFTHRPTAGFRYRGESYNFNVNLAYQYRQLDGTQVFPEAHRTSQGWHSVLPDATFQYRFSRDSNIRLNYNTNTRIPSAGQLQDVIDNSDPLRFSAGNPDLNEQYNHRTSLRYRKSRSEDGASLSAMASFTSTVNHIGNRTIVADQPTTLDNGIELGRGARFTQPDNIGNAYNFRAFVSRGTPIDLISSNLSFHGGYNFSRTPSMLNEQRNLADNQSVNSRISISSNISDRIDFNVSYGGSYHFVRNSIRPEMDNNYFRGRGSMEFNLLPWRGLVIGGEMDLNHYVGLGDDFNQSVIYWNQYLGYRFLEEESLEVRFSIYDILAQNDNINRSISEDYIQDYRTNVLSRYALITLRYNFRSF